LNAPDGGRGLWDALKRNRLFQAALVFASGAWIVVQAADVFELPTGVVRSLGFGMLGVFVVLAVAALVAVSKKDGATAGVRVPGRRYRAVFVVSAALVLLGAAGWWIRPRLFGGVRPGADVMAVLPFSTTGPSVELLGEGLVDLLSTNLGETAGIRTIDPRTTLHHWRQAAGRTGTVDLEGSLAVGRTVGAGSVLLGSAVEASGAVRLTAELRTVDGVVLALARTEGPADDVFALVDRLSIDLLREIWRSSEPLPQLRLSAITTESLPALRAFLEGEQFVRRSQWDSARTSLERAVAEDSTFALAHFRLGETYGWSEGIGSGPAIRHSDAATRFADRLPARERSLVIAQQLHETGQLSALDTLEAYTRRFPDDVGGWHMYADAQYHSIFERGTSIAQVRSSFDRVLELDPGFAPAYQHSIELSLALRDSARLFEHLDAWSRVAGREQVKRFHTLRALVWGPAGAVPDTFAAAFRDGTSRERNSFVSGLFYRALDPARPDPDIVIDALDRVAAEAAPSMRVTLFDQRIRTLIAAGRLKRARLLLDSMRTFDADQATQLAAMTRIMDIVPDGFAAAEFEALRQQAAQVPQAVAFVGLVELMRGNPEAADRVIEPVFSRPDTANLPMPMFRVLRAWSTVQKGDTVNGTARFAEALYALGYGSNDMLPALIALSLAETLVPESRARAVARLESLLTMQPVWALYLARPIGSAFEDAGHAAAAARVYSLALAVWEVGADPELAPVLDDLRQRLERIASEQRRDS
jgi:TolB-like protein